MKFYQVAVGKHFKRGNSLWLKQSSRTALLIEEKLWFYWGQSEPIDWFER